MFWEENMSFEIVTDSSANLPNDIIDKYNLHILSLVFRVNDVEYASYIKGEENDLAKFYDMMRNKDLVTTSCMSPASCLEIFEPILSSGKDVLYIGFSSALSGTYQTAHNVLEELKEKYPERKIYDIDTLGASLGEGLLVTYAAKQREEGKSIEEVHSWLMDNILHLCHWFTVDDLFFLKRGGRVSASAAVVGTVLGIKPVLHMDNSGRLIPVTKVRGRRKSLDALFEKMELLAINSENQIVYISHGDCINDAEYLANKIKERFGIKDILIHYVDPVIGAHSGPGTVALFFLGKER